MRKFNIFHIPVFSFFSQELYKDVRFNWKGTGLGYLFLLLLFCWAAFAIKIQIDFLGFANNEAPAIIKQFPKVTIKDGKLSINKKEPYYITGPDSPKGFIMFDSAGTIDDLNTNDDIKILVTQDKMIMKKSKFETRTYDFKSVKNFSFSSKDVTSWLNLFVWIFPLAFFLIGLLFSCLYRLIQLMIYTGIGMLFSLMLKREIDFLSMTRLTTVAVTPVIVLSTIKEIFPFYIPLFWLVCFILAMGYLFFGVFSCVQEPGYEENIEPVNDEEQDNNY